MASTPNLDKMIALGDERQHVQDFIDWLLDNSDNRLYMNNDVIGSDRSREKVMAAYFGIDLDEAERERMAVLEELREGHRQERVIKRRKARA